MKDYDSFPGLYRLVQSTRRYTNGSEEATWDIEVGGYTYYDPSGWMWVLLAPSALADAGGHAGQSRIARETRRGTVAYYGSYEVDASTRTVVHHLEIAVPPEWKGRPFVRDYEFRDNRLTLTIRNADHDVHTVYERVVR